jgi:hypothetical protein
MSVEKPLITTPEPPPAPFEPSQGPDGTKEIHDHEDADTNESDDTSGW